MIAVIFEVWPADGEKQHYLDIAASLRAGSKPLMGSSPSNGSRALAIRKRCCLCRFSGMRRR